MRRLLAACLLALVITPAADARIPRSTSAVAEFKRPNPDDAGDLAAKFEQRLAGLNVQSRQEVLTSKKGERLQPDEQLRAEAEVAARNGRVTSVGVDEHGTPVEASTARKPKRIPMRFIEAKETIRELIKRAKNL